MKNKVVLMFAYHFPPENAVGGTRPYRFYKYLCRMGYRCHVITAADQSGRPDLDSETVSDPFVTGPRQGLGWQAERAVRRFLLPGVVGMRWSLLATCAARNFLRTIPDAQVTVFSTYPPLGTHLAGFHLARSEKLPWIADFRDPMGDNPSHPFLKHHQHQVYRWMERKVLKAADIVIANTDAVAEKWKRSYPSQSNKFQLIWNGFDPESRVPALPLPERNYQVVSHVGELYQGRSVTALLESFGRLMASGQLSPTQLRVRLVGSTLPESLPGADFLHRATAAGWLELVSKRVPHHEALAIAQTSNALLLIQPHSTVQVPGKLFEYLQIGRPVLAYILRGTPIERILRNSGVPYHCVYADSAPAEMDRALKDFFELQAPSCPANAWFEENFDASKQTENLERLIRLTQQSRSRRERFAQREAAYD
jgi:glycosyltransferase involved in cell wall biosynthesis